MCDFWVSITRFLEAIFEKKGSFFQCLISGNISRHLPSENVEGEIIFKIMMLKIKFKIQKQNILSGFVFIDQLKIITNKASIRTFKTLNMVKSS